MQPQETDESDDSMIVSVHEDTEPDLEQIDEDGNHLERGQDEETNQHQNEREHPR